MIFIEPADPKAYDTLQYKIAMMVCGVSDWIQQVVNVTCAQQSVNSAYVCELTSVNRERERDITVVYY